MSQGARELLVAIARALAPERRVLLAGDDFEVLQLLAGRPLKELVVISALADPDAPAGTTMTGAPLRMRPDWGERNNSKDVVIDLNGEAPADQVARVLKKAGVYLSLAQNEAFAALPHQAEWSAKLGAALALGETGQAFIHSAPSEPGPTVFAAGKTAPEMPHLCVVTATGGADPKALQDAEARITAADAARQTLDEQLAEARSALATLPEAKAALTRAEAAAAAAEEALRALQSEHAELQTDYQTTRDDLAALRVEDGRAERLRLRLETLAQDTSREIAELRDRLRVAEAPVAEVSAQVAARDAARAAYRQVTDGLLKVMRTLVPDWPGAAAPTYDDAQLDAWVETVTDAATHAANKREKLSERVAADAQTITALTRRAHELAAALKAQPAPIPVVASPEAVVSAPVDEHVAALQAALAAERALREAERAGIDRARSAAGLAQEAARAAREDLNQAQGRSARAALAQACAEEDARLARAEAALQRERITDLEGMLAAHGRMQALLAEGLRAAEDARDEAESEARVADANLTTLRQEFERLQPDGADRRSAAAARSARQAALETERALADAQRQIAQLEETARRQSAERQLRPPAQ